MKKTLITFVILLVCCKSYAQNDSINRLEEVWIQADRKLEKHSAGYKVITLNDSVILKNTESFTSLLRFNSPIYLREFGAGGTSSASFRGTSASNTAVIWNGININSINNGQTGFNSLTVSLFDAINVRSGGGSIEYGSGAIGGTIHLNDNLQFTEKASIKNQLLTSLGSFDTYQGLYKFKLSNSKLALNLGVSYNQSENDYELLGTELNNFNGAFENFGFNASGAFFISETSNIKFYSTNYYGERFFSGELPNPLAANDKYQDFNQRNLVIYTNDKKSLQQEVKLAFLTQEYRYFADRESNNFTFGKSRRYLANYNVSYNLAKFNTKITLYSEYESAFGGTDEIKERNRRQFSQSFVLNHNVNRFIAFETKLRKDFNSDYEVPYTYALGAKVKPITNLFLRANGSRNYRVPTYNDLFWPEQGNLDLLPETASQVELGIGYKNKNVFIDLAAFYIDTKDKIVWTPNGDPDKPGIWVPINLLNVVNKGFEASLTLKETLNKHKAEFSLNYSYTLARNKETEKQLIYVPFHNVNANLSYNFKKFSSYYQFLYVGEVFISSDNNPKFKVDEYFVSNLGFDYSLDKHNKYIVGAKMNNLFNFKYEVVSGRIMPGRHYNFYFNFNF